MEKEKTEKKENLRGGFGGMLKKASDIAKKAVDGAQKGVATITEKTKQSYHEYQLEKYRPLMEEDYRSASFKVPNIIEIVDGAVRRDVAVCKGAIGWLEEHKGVDVLHLYEEFARNCGLTFVPVLQCDNVYCVDNYDQMRYLNVNCIFGKATEERMAELAHIAYSLGAKKCSIEIVETDDQSAFGAANTKASSKKTEASRETSSAVSRQMNGKRELIFEGNASPVLPTLKWFSHDDNIKGLIEMRCSGNNAIRSTVVELSGANSATMSKKVACALDGLLKASGSASMEKRSILEHSSRLVLHIEF